MNHQNIATFNPVEHLLSNLKPILCSVSSTCAVIQGHGKTHLNNYLKSYGRLIGGFGVVLLPLLILAQPTAAEAPATCAIKESETNDFSFQLFDCSYSRSQIQAGKVGFQLETNSGILIILSVRPGAEVITVDGEKTSSIIVTPWIVEKALQTNNSAEITIYNKQTRKVVTIDMSF